jgi:predicted nucleic acid-binding protein
MIVVDTNVLAYLFIPGNEVYTSAARSAYCKDPDWYAPYLWRSEFRNILALYLRQGLLTYDIALSVMREAESLMQLREYRVPSLDVLSLVSQSTCSAYDCEFVALARNFSTVLVTSDKKIV